MHWVPVSATVLLGGTTSTAYRTPQELVDAALDTPGMLEWLQQTTVQDWGNISVSFWGSPPYPAQPRLDSARGAPDGILELGLFTDTGWGDVVLDPWTGESFGFKLDP